MTSVGGTMSLEASAAIGGGFGGAVKKSIELDDTMGKVKGTCGGTGDEFKEVRRKGVEMGGDSKLTG
ncbi:hypothetical protein [Staphylococcus epidermidis]|uniref:hypothetical protein n=1 Tax=Staphylococcus epidermidis TaxID=1282 RepID=UPI0011A0C019|nr:hypothetical protein [Staphylococcus epidermidis]